MSIEVKIPITENLDTLAEVKHVSELKFEGIPMRGNTLIQGVTAGVLTFFDTEEERTYSWVLKSAYAPPKSLKKWFSKQFRVCKFETLGETWYEVQEKSWYWPVWDSWTMYVVNTKTTETIKYQSLYVAKEAIKFYRRLGKPARTIVDLS